MAENERTYVIPLRKAVIKTARWRRAKKAISTIRAFMKRHMKAEVVKIGRELNEVIWERGGKKVPSKVNVVAFKEENVVEVNLAGATKKKPEKKEKKIVIESKESKEEKSEAKEEKPKEEKKAKEETKEEAKKEEKSE
jgi:large subunit ribosomal protein L31e